MGRKTCIVVRWKKSGKWEAWSSLAAFSSFHPGYPTGFIRRRTVEGVFEHYRFELRRVEWRISPVRLRVKGLARKKPGPKAPRTKRT
ncbi:MAG: hypothetical protein KIT10_14500 [Flavobacteriales bacterium]|nr:hypothetical protein [Flavobacteriales bacterium]